MILFEKYPIFIMYAISSWKLTKNIDFARKLAGKDELYRKRWIPLKIEGRGERFVDNQNRFKKRWREW